MLDNNSAFPDSTKKAGARKGQKNVVGATGTAVDKRLQGKQAAAIAMAGRK